jgi:NADH-quinone oxidoreductase subunit G
MATFQLDDNEIPFESGDTVLRAAHRAGIDIPHYCWHPGLSVAANCRMCLVELLPPPGRQAMLLDVLRWDEESQAYVKERKPKLVPACQQAVSAGMQIRSQTSDHVSRARAAVQEMLLLNHPVDCPICDQAGECRLQDYWLSQGATKKRMNDEPVHKPKAVVFGPHIVYDAERCIVCTRCVRVSSELAKDPVLSVSERGNLNEIIVAPGRKLDHNYSLMTEYVCPVGALTSKEFRFKARVWFLRSARSICVGCSTGCNSFTDYDPRESRVHRYRPRENPNVNQYWMCDSGMLDYQRIHEGRVLEPRIGGESVPRRAALDKAAEVLREARPGKLAILLGAQFSLEDNAALLALGKKLGCTAFFESGLPPGAADGVLMQADKNPNSAGVRRLLGAEPKGIEELVLSLKMGSITHMLILGASLKDPNQASRLLDTPKHERVVLSTHDGALSKKSRVVLPASSWAESDGTFVNSAGLAQTSEQAIVPKGLSLPAWKWVSHLAKALGHDLSLKTSDDARLLVESPTENATAAAQTESQS